MASHKGRHRRPSNTAKVVSGVTIAGSTGIAAAAIMTAPGASAMVLPQPAPATAQVVHSVPVTEDAVNVVTIHSGDSLSGIAGKVCGNPADWTGIWNYNHKTLRWTDPNVIPAGQHIIPDCRNERVWLPRQAVTTAAVTPDYRHQYSAPQQSASYVNAGTYSYSGLENLWESAGGPSWAASSAAAVAECESGGNANAYNPSGATGVWQILGSVVAGNLDDPQVNAENAVSKFKASGDTFAQWVCQP